MRIKTRQGVTCKAESERSGALSFAQAPRNGRESEEKRARECMERNGQERVHGEKRTKNEREERIGDVKRRRSLSSWPRRMSMLFQHDAKTIGILGGGQLATMMIEAAHRMGCNVAVLDPNPSCSASHVLSENTDTLVVGDFNNEDDVVNFVEKWFVYPHWSS